MHGEERRESQCLSSNVKRLGCSNKAAGISTSELKLAFELAQRLTQIKSAFELPSVLSEFPLKQFAMLQKFLPAPRICCGVKSKVFNNSERVSVEKTARTAV